MTSTESYMHFSPLPCVLHSPQFCSFQHCYNSKIKSVTMAEHVNCVVTSSSWNNVSKYMPCISVYICATCRHSSLIPTAVLAQKSHPLYVALPNFGMRQYGRTYSPDFSVCPSYWMQQSMLQTSRRYCTWLYIDWLTQVGYVRHPISYTVTYHSV